MYSCRRLFAILISFGLVTTTLASPVFAQTTPQIESHLQNAEGYLEKARTGSEVDALLAITFLQMALNAARQADDDTQEAAITGRLEAARAEFPGAAAEFDRQAEIARTEEETRPGAPARAEPVPEDGFGGLGGLATDLESLPIGALLAVGIFALIIIVIVDLILATGILYGLLKAFGGQGVTFLRTAVIILVQWGLALGGSCLWGCLGPIFGVILAFVLVGYFSKLVGDTFDMDNMKAAVAIVLSLLIHCLIFFLAQAILGGAVAG